MQIIEPKRYFDAAVFAEEAKKIYATNWLYACLTDDVKEFRDYVVVNVMGHSVIIFNNGKEIKAFQNVCPHRFNRIFTDEKGNGPLVCRYHQWGFNEDGKLIGKDKKNIFPNPVGLDICLKQYPIEIAGKFIFIHFSDTPAKGLDEQLGKLKEDLLLVSEVLGEPVYEQNIPHKTNWKFIVENVVEIQHCKAIHQETLFKAGYCTVTSENIKVNNNSYAINPPLEDEARKKRDTIFNKYLLRKINNHDFKHILLYPNFTLAVFEGIVITIGQLLPVNENTTVYRLRYFFTKLLEDNTVGKNILEDMKTTIPEFNDKLFAEDKEMLENLQKGVTITETNGFIYESEKRLVWFIESYLNDMQ